MHILVTAATAAELLPAREVWETVRHQSNCNLYIEPVETGIGITPTSYHTLKALLVTPTPYDLTINIGIAGAFDDSLPLGSTVRVVSDYFGNQGIQTASGFQTLFDAQLLDADTFPFTSGKLFPTPLSPKLESMLAHLTIVNGVTVQHIVEGGTRKMEGGDQVETMEGAAFFYVCLKERIPCVALRTISNRVGERDKTKWNIPLALSELRKTLTSILYAI